MALASWRTRTNCKAGWSDSAVISGLGPPERCRRRSITNHQRRRGETGATGKFPRLPDGDLNVARTPAPVLRWELAERGCPRMLATIAKGPIKGLAMLSG
jgi:hypothetical protein